MLAAAVGFTVGYEFLDKTIQDTYLKELPDSDYSNYIREERGLPIRLKPVFVPEVKYKSDNNFGYFESTRTEESERRNPIMTYDLLREQNRKKYEIKTSMPNVSADQNSTILDKFKLEEAMPTAHQDDYSYFESKEESNSDKKYPSISKKYHWIIFADQLIDQSIFTENVQKMFRDMYQGYTKQQEYPKKSYLADIS